MRRSAGILLHITSLPGEFGIGGFGKEAVVLKPRRLKDKLRKYYSEAVDAYEVKTGSYSGSSSPG